MLYGAVHLQVPYKSHRLYTQIWEDPWQLMHYAYDSEDELASSRSQVKHSVHTNIRAPVASCKLSVLFRRHTNQFTGPREAFKHKQHFCTPAVWSCIGLGCRDLYKLHYLCTQLGRSRSTLYTRCTIPKMHWPIDLARLSTLMLSAYSSPSVLCFTVSGPVQVQLAVHTNI